MTADLRALLAEAADILKGERVRGDFVERADAALAEKAPEPVAWREKELSYVVEECKRIRILGLNEMRDALTDIAAWAANRLMVAPPPVSPDDNK